MIDRNHLASLASRESEFCTVGQFRKGHFDIGYILPHPKFKETPSFGSKVFNSYHANDLSRDKMKCSQLFLTQGIPTPDTLLSASGYELFNFVKKHTTIILKYRYGSGGRHLFVLSNTESGIIAEGHTGEYYTGFDENLTFTDVNSGRRRRLMGPFYAQEYVFRHHSALNTEVCRAYVIGNEVPFCAIRKKNDVVTLGDSIVNIANGAHYEIYTPSQSEISVALKVAEIIGFEVGVVDFLYDVDGNMKVIECDCDGRRSNIDRKFTLSSRPLGEDYNTMILKRIEEIGSGANFRNRGYLGPTE